MRKCCPNITIAIAIVIVLGCRATAQAPPVVASPQFFTLNLLAGVSLISAPLDTGQGLARDAFLGLPPQYPLFFGWDPDTQDWVSGDLVPAGIGGGYWIYLPIPATLVVAGQPYSYLTSLTKHVDPGWHLFGVPFQEGIGWNDFHLYASGNPIGLDAAVGLGWIDANVITVQGSVVQDQPPGQPLVPGVAYWVRTLVPLELRAERPADATPPIVPEVAPPATPDASPSQPQLVGAQPSSSSGQSTATSVMGWLGAIASFLSDAAKGAFQISEGNFAGGGFEFAAGTFGLVEYGLGEATPPTDQFTQMDAKLDTLITDVSAISGQLTTVAGQISGLQNWINSDTVLGTPLANAEVWLGLYLQDPRSDKSRQWARWKLAGCDTGNLLVAVCPEAANPVTPASYLAFQANHIQHPNSTNNSDDDFPLWWAYSVVGGQNGVTQWNVNGSTVDALEKFIFHGLTDNQGTPQNGLYAYMEYVFSKSGCTTDVSASGCDLFDQVYLPVETYFSKAIGDQTQLVEAQAEALGVLGEKYTAAHPGSGQSAASDLMAQTNGYLNAETEAFLRVAEQIALYRAADGTKDWNNFGSSDAGQLLARADFIAAQLAGQNYQTTAPTGYVNPPWPSSGVVGRVFYLINEGPLQATQTRGVCTGTVASQAFCGSPVGQISEDITSYRTPTGDWPYLSWQTSGSGTSALATGTLNTEWKVQRLKPLSLSLGQYVVNSTISERLGANLVVATYDSNYNSIPAGTTGGIVFGSMNGIEGPIGKYGLTLTQGLGSWTTAGGTTGDVSAQLSISHTDATDAPGGAYLKVTYPPIPGAPSGLDHGATSSPWVWSTSQNIQLNSTSLTAPFTKVHVHWPTTLNVSMNGAVLNTSTGICGSGCGRNEYYSYIKLDQQLLDNKGTTFGNASVENNQCNSSPFNHCNITGAQSLDVGSLGIAAATQYTFKASFSSAVDPYDRCFCGNSTWRSATGNSAAAWVINAPMLTLTKQ